MAVRLLALFLVACGGEMIVEPDAGIDPDAADLPTSGEYWPCYSWQETSETVTKCAPECSNYGTVGKYASNGAESCEIADGVYCDPKYINGQAWEDGVGCCVYSKTPFERVEFLGCL